MSRVGPCGLDKGRSPFFAKFLKDSAPRSRPNKYRSLLPSQQRNTSGQRRVQRAKAVSR